MDKINNYNKEEHIQFIESLIKTEQVAVFINNMDISEQSKIEQNDTLEYLYNRIIELQNNWNELKKYISEQLQYYSLCEDDYKEFNILDSIESKMQELEEGKDE